MDDDWYSCLLDAPSSGPALGSVWTIDALRLFGAGIVKITAFKLDEWQGNTWFQSEHFVPLDGNEDISVFTAMLGKLPANHKQPATVGSER